MQNILDNKYVIGVLTMFIFLYAATIRPELPPYIKVLFKNPIFKVFVLFLIVVRGNKDPLFALAIAIAFVTTLTFLNQQQAKEAFENFESEPDTEPVNNSDTEPDADSVHHSDTEPEPDSVSVQ
jgi:hypothetical protein